METFIQTCEEYCMCGLITEFQMNYQIGLYQQLNPEQQRAYDKHSKTILDKLVSQQGEQERRIELIHKNLQFYTILLVMSIVAIIVVEIFL
ncbi:MAG: hypothetical protein ACON43_07295 [Flavobacteriaceae bacterium]